jgi:hypothetical protein
VANSSWKLRLKRAPPSSTGHAAAVLALPVALGRGPLLHGVGRFTSFHVRRDQSVALTSVNVSGGVSRRSTTWVPRRA